MRHTYKQVEVLRVLRAGPCRRQRRCTCVCHFDLGYLFWDLQKTQMGD